MEPNQPKWPSFVTICSDKASRGPHFGHASMALSARNEAYAKSGCFEWAPITATRFLLFTKDTRRHCLDAEKDLGFT
jgi:hypothetical protein